MSIWKIIFRSLCHYWRTHTGVVLGAAVSTAVLTGALLVGDSVRFSLHAMVSSRLGDTHYSLGGQNRFFRSALAGDMSSKIGQGVAPVLKVRSLLIHPDSGQRTSHVQLLGVNDQFWRIGNSPSPELNSDEILINQPLAHKLGLATGDSVLLRMEKPHLLSQEAPLSLDSDDSVSQRMTVKAIVPESDFGQFSLQPNQRVPYNAFVSLDWLGEKVELANRANLLLVGGFQQNNLAVETLEETLKQTITLEDLGLEILEYPQQNQIELRTQNIFLHEEISRAAARSFAGGIGVFSYFVNELEHQDNKTPYSIISAIGPLQADAAATFIIPSDLGRDEIVLNQWVADDLQAAPGDTVSLTYLIMKPGRTFEKIKSPFTVKDIVPMQGPALDATLMPEFPGLSDKENCQEWEPGIEIDLEAIRTKDEEYWDAYQGTPKAFLALSAGQEMWANRFGNLTAVRWPLSDVSREELTEQILQDLYLPAMGFFFQPVREQGLMASSQAMDFGGLFIGLSFFLIVAALVLMGLLFALGMEQRAKEVAIFSALGLTWKKIVRIFFGEGMAIAICGSLLGLLLSIAYTQIMIYGLNTFWSGAVAGSALRYHSEASSMAMGWFISIFMAGLILWNVLRKFAKKEIRTLMDATDDMKYLGEEKKRTSLLIAWGALILACALIVFSLLVTDSSGVGEFFGAGVLLLVSGIAFTQNTLYQCALSSSKATLSLYRVAILNTSRKQGRSLGIVVVLACASFMVFSVSANLKNPMKNSDQRSSGTGGFALLGESTLPILHNLNTEDGRQALGLREDIASKAGFVQLRVHEGGDASCLNLNRVQNPQLLGVSPDALETRNAFSFLKTADGRSENFWLLLHQALPDNRIPAITDQGTLQWGLNKKIGDTIDFIDENGESFTIEFVGSLKSSLLQGSVFIAEDALMQCFPSEAGYRLLLIDAPFDERTSIAEEIERAGRNQGLEIIETEQRLAEYYRVEKTYLSIFLVLGGLGMILGCVGLAVVLLRNAMERRSELALLQAVGITRSTISRLLFIEHGGLLLMGLACGVISAMVAVIPALRSLGTAVPWFALCLVFAAILMNGIIWIWLSVLFATKESFLNALRNE
jgi:putative ABC transport system permease protein